MALIRDDPDRGTGRRRDVGGLRASWSPGPTARAEGVEILMVPSAAMGRDIPVAFQGGGPHAVVLLDAFNAAPDVSNWVTAGNAMNTLAGKGISVAAPAGGAWSMYTNWEPDGSRQWETFLADELPNWLAANKGLAPGRARHRRRRAGRHRRADDGDLPPGPLPLRRLAVGLPHPVGDRDRTAPSPPGSRSSAASTPATCGVCHSWAGGSGTTPTCTCSCWPTTTPGCGCTARPRLGVQRPGRDDRLLRSGAGQQPDLLSALPRSSAATTATSTSRPAATRLGHLGRAAGRDVGRTGRRHQVGKPRLRPGAARAAGTLEECSTR